MIDEVRKNTRVVPGLRRLYYAKAPNDYITKDTNMNGTINTLSTVTIKDMNFFGIYTMYQHLKT